MTKRQRSVSVVPSESALVVDGHNIRRDGEMWCMTDLWRAAGATSSNKPSDWLRKDGAAFVEFLEDSAVMGQAHNEKRREIVRSIQLRLVGNDVRRLTRGAR